MQTIRRIWLKVKIYDYFTARQSKEQKQNEKILIKEIRIDQEADGYQKSGLLNVPKSFNFDNLEKENGLYPISSRDQNTDRKS